MDRKWIGNGPEMDRKWTGNGSEKVRKWIGNGPNLRQKKPDVTTRHKKKRNYFTSSPLKNSIRTHPLKNINKISSKNFIDKVYTFLCYFHFLQKNIQSYFFEGLTDDTCNVKNEYKLNSILLKKKLSEQPQSTKIENDREKFLFLIAGISKVVLKCILGEKIF